MTSPAPDAARIDFAALTDQLRILPASRSWVSVQDSIRMLQTRSPAERMQTEMQDHVESVEVFAGTIRNHAVLIADAFACAVMLARLTQSANATSTPFGALQTLSKAYNFNTSSTENVQQRLRAVRTTLGRYVRGEDIRRADGASSSVASAPLDEPLSQDPTPAVNSKADVGPYFAWLDKVLNNARETPAGDVKLLRRIQFDGWESLLARYASELRSSSPPAPDVAEAICSQAGLPPSSVLGFSVRETPAIAWSKFVLPDGTLPTSEQIAIPWWAHGLSAHALGFHSPDRARMDALFSFLVSLPWRLGPTGREVNGLARIEFFRHYDFLFAQRSLPQTLLVVRREADSLVARWPTCPTAAVLPMTVTQANALFGAAQSQSEGMSALVLDNTNHNPEWTVAVEHPMENQSVAVVTQLLSWMRSRRNIEIRVRRVLFGPGASEGGASWGDIVVPNATRYEDLLASGIKSAS